MSYDEGLAQRIRELLEDDARIRERKMFGGIAFLANGNMALGIIRDELMVRVGPEGFAAALAQPHARAMDFTGRPMGGFVQVAPAGFEEDADLRSWLARGIDYAALQTQKPRRAAKQKPAAKAKKLTAKSAPKATERAGGAKVRGKS